MPGICRMGDYTLGMGSHGNDDCPHSIVGFYMQGSPNVRINGLQAQRMGDFAVHNCPHCGFSMAIQGYPTVLANGMPVTLRGHAVTTFCGMGMNMMASMNVRCGG